MIQGNITVENNLILKQPLSSYDGTVKYAKYDSEGNLLEDYPTNEDFTSFRVNNTWNTSSLKDIGIDNTNNDLCIESTSYGNGVCITTFKDSRYIAQSLDYGDTWELIDMGYVAKRTTTFINDAHYIVDYKKIYILTSQEDRFIPNINVFSEICTIEDTSTVIVPNNNGTKFLILANSNFHSDSLKFSYKIVNSFTDINSSSISYIDKDKTTLGMGINSSITIKKAIYDNTMGKFIVFAISGDSLFAITISTDGNTISSSKVCALNTDYNFNLVDYINTGSKQIISESSTNKIYYTNDMKKFTTIDLSSIVHDIGIIYKIKYVNGMYFIFIYTNTEYILKSSDGINWKLASELPYSEKWCDVIYLNNRYYFIDKYCNIVSCDSIGEVGDKKEYTPSVIKKNYISNDAVFSNYKGYVKCGDKYIICEEDYICVSNKNSLDKLEKIESKELAQVITDVNYIFTRTNNGIDEAYIYAEDYFYSITTAGVKNICISNNNSSLLGADNIYKVDKLIYSDKMNGMCAAGGQIFIKNIGDNYIFQFRSYYSIYNYNNAFNNYSKIFSTSSSSDNVCIELVNDKYILLHTTSKSLLLFTSTDLEKWSNKIVLKTYSGVGIDIPPSYIRSCYGNNVIVYSEYHYISSLYYLNCDTNSFTEATINNDPLISADIINDICYGSGKFVAIYHNANTSTNTNKALYSEDGKTWTTVTMPSSAYWSKVCYGNGKFVALAVNGTSSLNVIAYSTDGKTWTAGSIASSNHVGVCYGDGKFVVMDSSGKAYYSTDGKTWTATTIPSSITGINSVCYGDGKFVAFNSNPTAIYSYNGIDWKEYIDNTDISICEVGTSNVYRLSKTNTITKYTIPDVDSTKLCNAFMLKCKNIRIGGKAPVYQFKLTVNASAPTTATLSSIMSSSASSLLTEAITNPLTAFGLNKLVLLSKDSSMEITVDLRTNESTYTKTNSTLSRDTIIDLIFTCGLFIAIGKNYVFYSKNCTTWNYKKISELGSVANAITSGSVTYIPDKQRLLILNTSFKGNSYMSTYDNYLGLVDDLDDHSYTIDDVYDHVRALSDLYTS